MTAPPQLELALDPADLPRLARLPGMQPGRATPLSVTWHDTPDAALAASGRILVEAGAQWRLERLAIPGPGQPPSVLHQARRRTDLPDIPDGTAPILRLEGRQRTLRHGAITLSVLSGTVSGQPPLARLRLQGPAPELAALLPGLASLPLQVPWAGLAAELLAARTGDAPAPPPRLDPFAGQEVHDALAAILGSLTATLLRWSDQVTGAAPEPVHQMRVTIRRLRSALTVFRPVLPGPEPEQLRAALQAAATRLGTARDWDVFLDGIAARMQAAFPDERRVATLLRAAARRRAEAYAELGPFLRGPEFRGLAVALAAFVALRPWETAPHTPVEAFAAEALTRRARKVRKAGKGLRELPIPALHELRKDCKRLRYTADFFAPLFPERPVRRYTRRLAALQEELGRLNDGAAVPALLAQLGRTQRGFAAGLAEGLATAQAAPAREGIAAAWHRFRKADRFWPA